jgi:formylglycine-generating enzyme required for sulfatase activity
MAAVGFVPKEEVLGINADQKLDWKLPKDAGVLEIVTKDPNVSVPVTVDGKEVGVTPLTGYELRPGPHVIVAGDPKCSSPHEIQLVVERGQERKVEVEPVERPAGLYITAKDSRGNIVRGEVWVDGKLLGKTLEAVKVPVCARQAEVRTEKHGSATVDLSLREKETARMDVRLAGGGVDWVRFEGGVFTMGTKSGESSDERPTHEVDLDPFELARTETTVAQYEKCVDEGRCSEPRSSRKTDNYGKSDRKDHPVNAVTFSQAEAFCSFVGGRLPTEAEWEFASRSGGKDTKYPWGSAEPSCDRMVMKESGKPNGCGKKMTAPVCSRPQGNTEQGLCDMGGNVWEWTSDWYGESYYRDSPRTNPPGPASGTERSLRGGMWFGPGERARNGNRYKDKPSTKADGLGFRCARDVGPRRPPEGGGVVAGLEPPQACGMKHHSANFGPVQVGTQVKLGSHRPVKGSRFWDEKMMQYVGRTAKVKKLDGVDPQGCPRVKVDVDGGVYWWRVRDLEIVGGAAAGAAVAGGGQLPDGRFKWGTWCFQRESGGLLIKNSKSSGGDVSFNLRESSNGWYWVKTTKGKFVMWSTGKGEPQSFSFSSYSCGGPEVSAGSYALGNWTLEFPPQGSNGDKLEIRHASQTHTPRLWRKSNGWADFHSTGTNVGTWYSTSDVPAEAAKAIGSAPTNTAGTSGGGELPQGRFKWGTYCFNRTGGGVFIKNSKSTNGTVRFNMRESSNGWYWFETNKGKYVMWSSGEVDKQSFTFDSYSCGGPEIGSGTYKAGEWTFDFPQQGTRGDKMEIQHASQTHTPRLWRNSNGWADYRTTGTKVSTWYSATDAKRGRISGTATRVPLTGGGTGVVVGSSNNSGGSAGSQGGPYGFASNAPRKSLPLGSFRVGTTWCARRSNKLVSFKNEISPRGVRFILPETSNGWYWVETKKGQYVMWSSGTSNPQTFTFPSTSCAGTTLSRGIYSAGEWEIYVPGNVSGDDRITFRHKSKNHAPLSLWYKSNGWADWKAKGGETKTIYSTTDPSTL